MMRTFVTVRNSFVAMHAWPDAPEEVAFLRTLHRHVFYVTTSVRVTGSDREIEFFMLQRDVHQAIEDMIAILSKDDDPIAPNIGAASCEQMAAILMEKLRVMYDYDVNRITVSEDNENEATVEWI